VVDEVVAELGGAFEGVVLLGQSALDVDARGHVDEGEERSAVGKGLCAAIEHRAVAQVKLA
jgi:hypothetical protein